MDDVARYHRAKRIEQSWGPGVWNTWQCGYCGVISSSTRTRARNDTSWHNEGCPGIRRFDRVVAVTR